MRCSTPTWRSRTCPTTSSAARCAGCRPAHTSTCACTWPPPRPPSTSPPIFANWLLRHPEALQGAEPRLRTLWLWHAAEESEHRSTAFDVYQALSGHHAWRIRLFRYITVTFLWDLTRQTLINLWHDGSLLRWSTWRSGWRLLWARDGMLRASFGAWRDYLAPDFHPSQHDATPGRAWLHEHTSQYAVVGRPVTG